MKKLTIRQMAAIKNVAKNVNPLVTTKKRLISEIEKAEEELKLIEAQIDGHEGGVKALTGGYTSEDIVRKTVEDTGKVDKAGKPVKVTKYIPTDIIVYNEEENCYYIPEFCHSTEGMPGSDFDADTEKLNENIEL